MLKRQLAKIIGISVLIFTSSSALAQVVPDGTTTTTTSTDSTGHVTVNIAPVFTGVTGDISHNSYTEFNVNAPGVSLDNRYVDARTIVNEVTGANPSSIQGTLEVLGPKANVILANPNGITVNGGNFINTGHTILTTGAVTYRDKEVHPDIYRRDPVLTTNKGVIRIEGEGLAGVFTSLELIAKKAVIDGEVSNNSKKDSATVRVKAGSTKTELDASVGVSDTEHPFSSTKALDTEDPCPNAICVNVTNRGSITSGRIEIAVTDEGAGVKLAGTMGATGSDVVMNAKGDILLTGQINAKNNAVISTTGDVTMTKQGAINAENAVVFQDVGTISMQDDATIASSYVKLSGKRFHMLATSSANDNQQASWHAPSIDVDVVDMDVWGSVSLNGGTINALGPVLIRGSNITLTALKDTLGYWTSPSIRSQASAVYMQARDGDIINLGGHVSGVQAFSDLKETEGAVTLIASGKIHNESLSPDAIASVLGFSGDTVLHAGKEILNVSGTILSTQHVVLDSKIGAIYNILATSSLTNESVANDYSYTDGSFLFKKVKVHGRSIAFGELLIPGAEAIISGDQGVDIQTSGDLNNLGGSILADNGRVTIHANHLENNVVQTGSAYAETHCHWICSSEGSSTLAVHGGLISAGQDILVTSDTMTEKGGNIVSKNGEILLNIPGQITLESVPIYSFLDVDRGIFHQNLTALLRHDQGGSLIANQGRITILSELPVILNGGQILTPTTIIPNGTDIVATPENVPSVFPTGEALGVLGGVL